MKLEGQFLTDIEEAYKYWCSKQNPTTIKDLTLEQWITSVLQKPVYELIGAKRTENA